MRTGDLTYKDKGSGLPIRLIQVGMGGWGQDWTRNIVRRSEDVELVACIDPNPSALQQAQSKIDVPVERCFPTVASAFDTVDADGVLITAALPAHVPVALEALVAGKHVLLEKPFAATVAEAQQVIAAADESGCILMISQNYRFFPAVRTVAELVRERALGPVGVVSVDFRRYANTAPREGHRHYTIPHPLLIDMAIHHFDLMRMVLGQEPRQVACRAWNPPWSNFVEPAAAVATIIFGEDIVVRYHGNWVSTAPQTAWAGEWHMECAGGEILWTSRGGRGASADRVTIRPLDKAARQVTLPNMPYIDRAGSLAAFVQAIRTGQAPESSGRDNLGSIALMNAAIESAMSGMIVPVASP